MGYDDPEDKGNSAAYHTGKACVVPGCTEPAGTGWSPHWCFRHNAERMRRIHRGFASMQASFAEGAKKDL